MISDYATRALEHAPKNPTDVAAAARTLAREFSVDTAAAILRLDVTVVRQMLGEQASGG